TYGLSDPVLHRPGRRHHLAVLLRCRAAFHALPGPLADLPLAVGHLGHYPWLSAHLGAGALPAALTAPAPVSVQARPTGKRPAPVQPLRGLDPALCLAAHWRGCPDLHRRHPTR